MPIFDFDISFVYNKLSFLFRDHPSFQCHYVSFFTFIGLFINQVKLRGIDHINNHDIQPKIESFHNVRQ
jgi:hypothetical protein